jgi:hypothetical protein
MGATRVPLSIDPALGGAASGRTPGPAGWQDAAETDAMMCLVVDTPGPVGTGGDAGATEPLQAQGGFDVVLIDEAKVVRRIGHAAFIRASLALARRDVSAAIGSGSAPLQPEIARLRQVILAEWVAARRTSGERMLEFVAELAESIERDTRALLGLYQGEVESGQRWARGLGYAGMVVATVAFGATVVRKVASNLTGPVGFGIDVVTDVAIAGIDKVVTPDPKMSVIEAEFEMLVSDLGNKAKEEAPEAVAARIDRIYELAEKFGPEMARFGELQAELDAKLAHLESLERTAPQQRKAAWWVTQNRRLVSQVKRLRALLVTQRAVVAPLRAAARVAAVGGQGIGDAARWAHRSGVATAAGRTAGVVFLAADVTSAYERWHAQVTALSTD